MTCNPWRWLWGIPLLAMWFWITLVSERPPIEADLTKRAQTALTQSGQGWAQAKFDGRDGLLTGRAVSPGDREKAAMVVRDTWGVRVLDDQTALLDSVERYVWSAEYASNQVALTGFIPNQTTHDAVVTAVKGRFPNATIKDSLTLARGGIEVKPWLKGISFGLDQLSDLERGKLDFVNMDYSLSGRAPSYAVYKDVRTALNEKSPKGVRLSKEDVSPPTVSPYTWNATRTATQVVLSGHVPSEKARGQLFESAKKRFPNLAIIDRMETGAGAVPGWSRATGVLIEQLAKLEDGEAYMSDAKLGLVGRAPSKEIADQVKSGAPDDVPKDYTLKTNLTFPKPKPPLITPFVTSIDADAAQVRLFGYVPSDDERAKLIAQVQAKFPDRKVEDNLTLGSGAPQSWRACLYAGLSGVEKLGAGRVRLEGPKVSVAGETTDEAIAENLATDVRALANRACASTVDVKLNLPPEPQLTWSANYDGAGKLVLDGEVPDSQTRTALMKAAAEKFPDAEISDQMTVVPGYAKKWRGVALTGLSLLAKLRKGRASISGQDLSLSGEAKDTAVASAVKGHLKTALVRGYTGHNALTVRSDSMIWAEQEAKRKAAAKIAATEAARLQAVADEKRAESQRLAALEAKRMQQKKDQASRLAAEDARLKAEQQAKADADERARVAREATQRQASEAAQQRAREAADKAAREADKKAAREATAKAERDACADAMRAVARSGVIRFKFASDDLDQKSHATLDEVAKKANTCPSFKIIVSGHTDSVGATHRNEALSKRRAQSVVDYLRLAGVPASRLVAVGYGETKPIARNETRAGRARNRRIEFDVQ